MVIVSDDPKRSSAFEHGLIPDITHRLIRVHSFIEAIDLFKDEGFNFVGRTDIFVIDVPADKGNLTEKLVKLLKRHHTIFFIGEEIKMRPLRANLCTNPYQPKSSLIDSNDVQLLDVLVQKVVGYVHKKDVYTAIDALISRRGDVGWRIRNAIAVTENSWKYLDPDTKNFVREHLEVDDTTDTVSAGLR